MSDDRVSAADRLGGIGGAIGRKGAEIAADGRIITVNPLTANADRTVLVLGLHGTDDMCFREKHGKGGLIGRIGLKRLLDVPDDARAPLADREDAVDATGFLGNVKSLEVQINAFHEIPPVHM